MKTQLFLSLTLVTALFFTSCSEDSDLVQPVAPVNEGLETFPSGDQASLGEFTLDYCIEVQSSHRLQAYLRNEPMRGAGAELSDASPTEGRGGNENGFFIRASGEGTASIHNNEDASGKSTVQLSMFYDPRSGRASGTVTIQLSSGEIVTQYLDGAALVQGDDQIQSIKANLISGQAGHNGDQLELINGYLIIGLPATLQEGWIESNLFTTSMFCSSTTE